MLLSDLSLKTGFANSVWGVGRAAREGGSRFSDNIVPRRAAAPNGRIRKEAEEEDGLREYHGECLFVSWLVGD
jgi:hypothetical protein